MLELKHGVCVTSPGCFHIALSPLLMHLLPISPDLSMVLYHAYYIHTKLLPVEETTSQTVDEENKRDSK